MCIYTYMYKCINMYINVYKIYIYICMYLALQPQDFDIGARQCVAVYCSQRVAVCRSVCCSVLGGCGIYLALQPRDFDIGSWNCGHDAT